MIWRLSAGTASELGLKQIKDSCAPTTAYIMLGERCQRSCRFCAQARQSKGRVDMLSRVVWPAFSPQQVLAALATTQGQLRRICLQAVDNPQAWTQVTAAIPQLRRAVPLPICVAAYAADAQAVAALLAAGAERVCVALDGATPAAYTAAKDGTWRERWELLTNCAARFPGRLSTHLIVGLGETDEEMVNTVAACMTRGITVGLFAFTPVRGTVWERREQPLLARYRRLQVAAYLLRRGVGRDKFIFHRGQLVKCSLGQPELAYYLRSGEAFRTSGCPDCNRPYYNERPGGTMYNYPRPLTAAETAIALKESGLLSGDEM